MTEVAVHVSPYKRIEIGSSPPKPRPIETEGTLAKAIREAAEDKQRIEVLRIWNHLVQTAQGCNSISKGEGDAT